MRWLLWVVVALVVSWGTGGVNADDNDPDALFAQGYLDGAGPAAYLRHLVEDVLPCEDGRTNRWDLADELHVSRAQFSWGSWYTASRATGFTDPLDPYHVGRNVAWWINAIDNPGSRAGWPHCWHVGNVP